MIVKYSVRRLAWVAQLCIVLSSFFVIGSCSPSSSPSPTQRKLMEISIYTSDTMSSNLLSTLSKLPRFDLHGHRVSNAFDPSNTQYWQSIFVMCIVFGVIAFLSLLFVITMSCCCLRTAKNSDDEELNRDDVYYRREMTGSRHRELGNKHVPQFFMLLIFCVLAGLTVLGYLTIIELGSGFFDAVNKLNDTASSLTSNALTVIDDINALNISAINETIPLPQDIINWTNQSHQWLDKFNEYRPEWDATQKYWGHGMMGAYAVLLLVCLCGFVSALILSRYPAYVVVIFAFVLLPFMWIFTAAYFPASVVISDFCPSSTQTIVNQITTNITDGSEYALFFLECNGSDPFAPLRLWLSNATYELEISLNATSDNATRNTIKTEIAQLHQTTLDLSVFAQCNDTASMYNTTKEIVCTDLLNGTFMMGATEALIATCLTFGFLLSLLAVKRFISFDEDDEEKPLLLPTTNVFNR